MELKPQLSRPAGWRIASASFLVAGAGAALAQSTNNPVFAVRADQAFRQAQIQFAAATNHPAAAVQLARASFDFAEFATNDAERADIANVGIAACQELLAREPKSAPGHYYLAMNFGRLAEAEAPSIAAYKLVKEIEHEFKTAAELNAAYDFAGPARCLGLLYRDAPGWPISIGSKRKTREWLESAVKTAPDYPENRLNLAEFFLHYKDREGAEKELNALDALWSKAQTEFSGEAWERSRAEWALRRSAARKKFAEIAAPAKAQKSSKN